VYRITHPVLLKPQEPLDPLTARTYLTSALSQFLGLMGTAIPLDILKLEQVPVPSSSSSTSTSTSSTRTTQTTKYQFLWLRVARDDAAVVVAALSSWVGSASPSSSSSTEESGVAWRVCAKGNYLAAIMHGCGGDVFD